MADDKKVPLSSIVMKAFDATTFAELQEFTKDLESRPTDRILRDVADLVQASESKAQIVSYVIATKFRRAKADERRKILDSLETTLRTTKTAEQRDRLNFIIERVRHEAGSGLA